MKTPISDQTINRNVTQLLASRGLRSPCHITVQSSNGVVTFTGTVQRQQQRDAANQVAQNVEGVRRIVDRLTIKPPAKQSYEQPPAYVRPLTAEEATAAELAATSGDAPAEPVVVEAPKYDKQGKRLHVSAPPAPPAGEPKDDNRPLQG
ncbi:MAG TPA: BON domain-containing protein [Pirellulales bacterium]|nr:BON domain-containing protein [Pirellulales bacterium]